MTSFDIQTETLKKSDIKKVATMLTDTVTSVLKEKESGNIIGTYTLLPPGGTKPNQTSETISK